MTSFVKEKGLDKPDRDTAPVFQKPFTKVKAANAPGRVRPNSGFQIRPTILGPFFQTRVGQGQEGQADDAGDDEWHLIPVGRAQRAEDQGAGEDPQGGGQ